MWITFILAAALVAASIIASSIIAAVVIIIPGQMQKKASRIFADPGRIEVWGIRTVAAIAFFGGIATYFLDDPDGFLGLLRGLWPELVGMGITVFFIDELNRRRSQRQYKQQIIRQMASRSNDFALDAARIAKDEGWLWDGSLKGAVLSFANLQRADLIQANLQRAVLKDAILEGAGLLHANLQGAHLWGANLQGATLFGTQFQGTRLFGVNLQGAKYDNNTKWPEGFDPEAAGAILVDDDD